MNVNEKVTITGLRVAANGSIQIALSNGIQDFFHMTMTLIKGEGSHFQGQPTCNRTWAMLNSLPHEKDADGNILLKSLLGVEVDPVLGTDDKTGRTTIVWLRPALTGLQGDCSIIAPPPEAETAPARNLQQRAA